MTKEKTLEEKIIFIDRLIASTFSKKTYLYYLNIIDEYIDQKEEIERLKIIEEKYKDSQLYIKDFKEEIERLNNIIKEVREYIENNWINQKDADIHRFDTEELEIEISDIAVLYEILDKESK